MRRGEEANNIAGRLQNGSQGVGDRTLAVSTRHMNGAELALRMSEMFANGLDVAEARLKGDRAYLLIDRETVVYVV